MIGLGTIINTAAVVAGGLLGLCVKKGMPDRMKEGNHAPCTLAGSRFVSRRMD